MQPSAHGDGVWVRATNAFRRLGRCVVGLWCLIIPLLPLTYFAARDALATGVIASLALGSLVYGPLLWAYYHGWRDRINTFARDVGVGVLLSLPGPLVSGFYRGLSGSQSSEYNGAMSLLAMYLGFLFLGRKENRQPNEVTTNAQQPAFIICGNCGRKNSTTRSVCLNCNSALLLNAATDNTEQASVEPLPKQPEKTGLQKGELIILWVGGLLTAVILIGSADSWDETRLGFALISAIWIVCGLFWLTLYRRRQTQ